MADCRTYTWGMRQTTQLLWLPLLAMLAASPALLAQADGPAAAEVPGSTLQAGWQPAIDLEPPAGFEPGRAYHNEALKAWNAGQRREALRLRLIAWYQKPSQELLYLVVDGLRQEGLNRELVTFLEGVPRSSWTPGPRHTGIYRLLAEALVSLGRLDEATDCLVAALDAASPDDPGRLAHLWRLCRFSGVAESLQGRLVNHAGRDGLVARAMDWLRQDWTRLAQGEAVLAEFLQILLGRDWQQDDAAAMARHLAWLDELLPHIAGQDKEHRVNAAFFSRAAHYWLDKRETASPYGFRWLVLAVPAIDALTFPPGKPEVWRTKRWTAEETAAIVDQSRRETAACGLLYFYLSRGRLAMEFDFQVHDATIRQVAGTAVVTDAMVPDPGEILTAGAARYDGIAWLNDNQVHPGTYSGGRKPLMLVPYALSSPDMRFSLHMSTGGRAVVWTHEIFHNFEQLAGIKPAHQYTEANQTLWSPAYRERVALEGRTSELWYYDLRFQSDLLAADPAAWRLREAGLGTLPPQAIQAARQRFAASGPEAAQQADGLRQEAAKALKEGQAAEADRLLEQARLLNPGNNRILADLVETRAKLKDVAGQKAACLEYLQLCAGLPETLKVARRLAALLAAETDKAAARQTARDLEPFLRLVPAAWDLVAPKP